MTKYDVKPIETKTNSILCIECDQFYESKDLLLHIQLNHSKTQKHSCYICGNLFEDIHSVTNHLRDLHNVSTTFSCLHCHAKFHSITELINHLKFVCNVESENSFPISSSLKDHSSLEHRAQFPNDTSKNTALSVNNKQKQIKQDHITADKTLTCLPCAKSFKRTQDLKRHVKGVHLKIRDFPCCQCDKKFDSNYQTEKHFRNIHLKIKDATCNLCRTDFSGQGTLNRHKRAVHLKLKPFKCEDCNTTFGEKGHLKVHQTRHCPALKRRKLPQKIIELSAS